MGLFGWIFYIIGGFLLFVFLHFLENKYSLSKIERIVFSIIIWLFLCEFCFYFAIPYTSDIFLMFVFLMVLDIFYYSTILNRDFFESEERNVLYYIVLILVGFFLNQSFINQVQKVLLTGDEIRVVLWFLLFIFLYQFGKNKDVFHSFNNKNTNHLISPESILVQYTKLRYQYGNQVKLQNKDLSTLTYAIMIERNQQRTKLLRMYDYFIFRLTGQSRKLGIMQVKTNHFITDAESIQKVYDDLEKLYQKTGGRGKKKIKELIIMIACTKKQLMKI